MDIFSLIKPFTSLTAVFVLAGFKDSNAIVQSLDCTNDLNEWISCDMTAPNCPQYKLLFIEEEK